MSKTYVERQWLMDGGGWVAYGEACRR